MVPTGLHGMRDISRGGEGWGGGGPKHLITWMASWREKKTEHFDTPSTPKSRLQYTQIFFNTYSYVPDF